MSRTRVPFPIEETLRTETLGALREALHDLYTLRNRTTEPFSAQLVTTAIQAIEVAIDAIND